MNLAARLLLSFAVLNLIFHFSMVAFNVLGVPLGF
jgi:hypothetical protein